VRPDLAERLRDDVPPPEFGLGALRLDEDDDASFVRLAPADGLVADRDPNHVGPGEDRRLVRGLRGADVVRWHGSPLPFECADLEEALAELAVRRRAGPSHDAFRYEADEDCDYVVREGVPRLQQGHHADPGD